MLKIKGKNMQIIINGEKKQYRPDDNIATILTSLSIHSDIMAVAVNMNIVKKDLWDSYKLKDGDCLEFLEFLFEY